MRKLVTRQMLSHRSYEPTWAILKVVKLFPKLLITFLGGIIAVSCATYQMASKTVPYSFIQSFSLILKPEENFHQGIRNSIKRIESCLVNEFHRNPEPSFEDPYLIKLEVKDESNEEGGKKHVVWYELTVLFLVESLPQKQKNKFEITPKTLGSTTIYYPDVGIRVSNPDMKNYLTSLAREVRECIDNTTQV
jgi:hypothetical protein